MNSRTYVTLLSVFFFTILSARVTMAQDTYWENGNVKTKIEEGGDGVVTEFNYDEDGTLRRKAEVNDNLVKTTAYYENGLLESVLSQKVIGLELVNHGRCEAYYSNGNMQSNGVWKDGKREGEYKEYYENGKVKSTGRFKDDLYVGNWMFYYENGKIRRNVHFTEFGAYDGIEMRYDENGNLTLKQEFANGVLVTQEVVPDSYFSAMNDIYGLFQRENEYVPFEVTYLSEQYEYKLDGTRVDKGIQTNYVICKGDHFAKITAAPAEADMQGGVPEKSRIDQVAIFEADVVTMYSRDDETVIISDFNTKEYEPVGMTFDDYLSNYTVIDVAGNKNNEGDEIISYTMVAKAPIANMNLIIRKNQTTGKLDGWNYYDKYSHQVMRCDVVNFNVSPTIHDKTFKVSNYLDREPTEVMDLRD